MYIETIKGVRNNYYLDLPTAFAVVVTDKEIEIFLKANAERELTKYGVERLAGQVFGGTSETVKGWVEASGYWKE